MKTILLTMEYPTLVQILWTLLVVGLGVIWYVIKTPEKVVKKEKNINKNIQSINRMGYKPEEDDELDGYHHAERPAVHLKPNTNINERFERLSKAGYYVNDHVMSVINKT